MPKGIRITSGTDIPRAKPTDFVVDSQTQGSLKIHKILTFKYGGDSTVMSSTFGVSAYIQRYNHGLKYVPAYLAYLISGDTDSPSFIKVPYNDFIAADGRSSFINVTSEQVIVGFDTADTTTNYIRVVLFAEKLADS